MLHVTSFLWGRGRRGGRAAPQGLNAADVTADAEDAKRQDEDCVATAKGWMKAPDQGVGEGQGVGREVGGGNHKIACGSLSLRWSSSDCADQ
jgi:hypothetical protein